MSHLPIISLLHPTARVKPSSQFPRGWKAAHDVWLARADHPERIEYVLAVHESRWQQLGVGLAVPPRADRWSEFLTVVNVGRDCVVDQTNRAAEASSGKVLMGVADDYYPPEHWDTLILEALCGYPIRDGWPHQFAELDSETILLCSSGATPERDRELMIAGAMTRSIYERRGFILDPDFESMYSDNWLGVLSRREAEAGLLKIIERLDVQFDHRHPSFGKGEMDEVYALQNRQQAYVQGYATFMRKAYGTSVLAFCAPGETFRGRQMWALVDLIVQLEKDPRFIVARHGGFSSNVYATRFDMTKHALEIAPRIDYALWIDDDNVVTYEQVLMLYQDLQEHPELAGVTGWCWCDNDGQPDAGWRMSISTMDENLEGRAITLEDWQRALKSGKQLIHSDDLEPRYFSGGFPFVLLRGDTMRLLGPQAFVPMVDSRLERGFSSEDTSFWYHARQAGLNFACDLRCKVPHAKMRAIEPQFIPESERENAKAAVGDLLASAAD
jgi:hypothetical protein